MQTEGCLTDEYQFSVQYAMKALISLDDEIHKESTICRQEQVEKQHINMVVRLKELNYK